MGRGHTEAAVDEYGFKRDYVDLWGDGSRDRRDERTLIFVFIWWRGQHTYPQTDKEAAVQRQQAEPLVIETPEPATEGSIRVYDYDGCCIYAYYGEIKINNDGRDGKQIDIECAGYLEGYQQHGEPERGVGE